jgi:CO/xanthine dehydrogenase Mo-binding subunit
MSETPDIEVHIVKSKDTIGGEGNRVCLPVVPALGNAVFDAMGVRTRQKIAADTGNVREAIKSA